jgi:predicted PurR-regulated permease PerM
MNGTNTARMVARMWLMAVAVLAVAMLYLAKVLFLPLAFAILFAFLLAPLVSSLERVYLPRALAAMVVIFSFVAILGCAGWVVFNQLVDVTSDLPTYRDNITRKMAAIHIPSDSAFSRAEQEVGWLSDQLGLDGTSKPAADGLEGTEKPLGASADRPVQVREVSKPTGRLDQLGGVVHPLTTAFLTVVFTFFVVLQREDLRNRLIRLTGDRNLTIMTQAMNDAGRRINRYFSLQLLVNLSYGSIIAAVLYFIGLPHPLLFGALAMLLRFIPYIGAPVAALLPTLLSMAVFHGWSKSLLIAATFFCMEVATANYIEPHIYGRHTGLSSLAILVAAAFWTLIWGPVGLILSVPLTVCLVVMGRHIPSLEFLSVMLGDQPVIPPWACFYQRLLARDEREAGEVLESSLRDKTLEEVYDSVLIPALIMSEEDRMHQDLENSTVRFIRQTTRELIEETAFRENLEEQRDEGDRVADHDTASSTRVMCIPVRDEVDELAALMLAQLLEGGRVHAFSTPVLRIEEMLETTAQKKPDIVFLSGLPPFGIGRSHRLYRTLRARNPHLKIMIGIWNYPEDPSEAAQKITRGEEGRVMTKLAEAVSEVASFARASQPGTSRPAPSPSLEAVPDGTAA